MADCPLLPATFSPRIFRGFAWYLRRLLRRDFKAIHLSRSTHAAFAASASHPGPLIVLMTHSAWWDPLIGLFLADRFHAHRRGCAPMDIAMIRKFGFFKKLGLFGIDPDHPDASQAMRSYVLSFFDQGPYPTLWLTPQGNFSDPRHPILLRPGAAAICAACTPPSHPHPPKALAIAIEYVFRLDRKAEVFIHAQAVTPPDKPSTPHWHKALATSLTSAAATLACDVQSLDPARFETVLSKATKVNPLFDLWASLTGRSNTISNAHRTLPPSPPSPHP
ncbi:MAG: lysophospholipid acyltransferase family protein [Planctomycetota bacterium]|nr:lysophospholipid acyltransferase family protein [Planctomycetota bacterium]